MLYPDKISRANSFPGLVSIASTIMKESNPVLSTSMGITLYNNLWPDISIHGVTQDIETLHAIQTKLQSLDPENDEEKQDYILLDWFVRLNLHELEEIKFWESSFYLGGLVLSGISSLVRKSHPDEYSRVQSIIARLRSVAPLIKAEKRRVVKPVQLWIDAEIRSVTSLIKYLQTLPGIFDSQEEEVIEDLKQSIDFASDELQSHLDWLELQEGGVIPVLNEVYEELIELRQLGYTVDELEELGWYYLDWTENKLEELSTSLEGKNIEETRQNIRSDHAPDFESIIARYRELADQARQFLIDNDLVTMPSEQLEVIPTPEPLRHFLSIAAAGMPGRFDKEQKGYFFCTPHDDEEMLKEHSHAYQPLLIAHESYPGHHLHGAAKNQHPSLVRSSLFSHPSANTGLLYSSKLADITEGWGLYAEEMMWQKGFARDNELLSKQQRFLQINAMRWRAARIVIDVHLHTGKMTIDEAVNFLMDKTGYEETTARAEVLMYSRSPGYFSSYLLGKHILVDLKKKLADSMTDKQFHDQIIYAGSVPWWYLKRTMLTDN